MGSVQLAGDDLLHVLVDDISDLWSKYPGERPAGDDPPLPLPLHEVLAHVVEHLPDAPAPVLGEDRHVRPVIPLAPRVVVPTLMVSR